MNKRKHKDAVFKNYISDKNYLALYGNSIGIKFASSLFLTFVGAHLYLQGLALHFIFLYFGLEFLLRGIFTPLSGILITKYGLKHTVIIANILLVMYFMVLSLASVSLAIGFASLIFHALSRGIYHPVKHYIEATLIKEQTRGHYLTLEIVVTNVTAALAILFATYSVTVFRSFLPVALAATLFLGFASFAILRLLDNIKPDSNAGYKEILKHVFSKTFRADFAAFTGFATNMAFNNVVVALLVFFVVDSLKLFGGIIALVFILEMVFILLYGRFIDKHRLASNEIASFLQIGSYVSFLGAVTPMLVAIIKTLYDIIWNIFDSSFTTRFHAKIHRHGIVFACAKEVSLSIACAVFCFALSIISYYWNGAVFEAALVIAGLGVVLAWKEFKDD